MRLFQRIILIIITLNTLSCVEDDIASRCESNCSTIGFRFFSNENEPLRGIRVNLSYRISNAGFVGGSLRRIIEVESDANGLINEEFFIQEDELGSSAEGFFLWI